MKDKLTLSYFIACLIFSIIGLGVFVRAWVTDAPKPRSEFGPYEDDITKEELLSMELDEEIEWAMYAMDIQPDWEKIYAERGARWDKGGQ